MIYNCASVLKTRLGCHQFHLVSGFASSPDSWFFIPRIKGECEQLVQSLNFDRLYIYRPGLLRCQRSGQRRPLEFVARCISQAIDLKNWWSVDTEDLAKVMIMVASSSSTTSSCIFEHNQIVNMLNDSIGK